MTLEAPGSLFPILPAELHAEIASKVDITTLPSLSRVSVSFYGYCSPFLYQTADILSIPTLALLQEDRLPLTGAHPATFVKEVMILKGENEGDYDDIQEKTERAKALIPAALNNVLKYAKDGLRSFGLVRQGVNLLEVFPNGPPALGSLKSLVIQTLLYYDRGDELTRAVNIMISSCSASLTRLELRFDISEFPAAAPLERLPILCPNLQQFAFIWAETDEDTDLVQSVINNAIFTFPYLKAFSIKGIEYPVPFLRRHPNLQVLRFSSGNAPPIDDPSLLPNLARFVGEAWDVVSLFKHGTQPIEHLTLLYNESFFDFGSDELEAFLNYLASTKTIRYLCLQPHIYLRGTTAYDWDLVVSFITSSPGLTTFVSYLDFEANKRSHLTTVYETILGNLPHLEHLKLWVETADTGAEQPQWHDNHKQAIESAIVIHHHRTLKSLQLIIRAYGEATVYPDIDYVGEYTLCFVRGAQDVMTSVPKLNKPVPGIMIDFVDDFREMSEL